MYRANRLPPALDLAVLLLRLPAPWVTSTWSQTQGIFFRRACPPSVFGGSNNEDMLLPYKDIHRCAAKAP